MWIPIVVYVFESLVFAASAPVLDPRLGSIVGHCKAANAPRQVWLFQQWHLAPGVNTHDGKPPQSVPQEKNQTAIYRQLEQWIDKGEIHEIYAEGCSGELNEASSLVFNGWSLSALKEKSGDPSYAEVVSHVPAKLEAKFGKKLHTVCGDDDALMKSNNLAFSDARGALGFLTRISQYKNDPARVKTYLEGVASIYHLSPSTTAAQAIARLKVELKSSIVRVKEAIEKRNAVLVKAIRSSKEPQVAVIFGGSHISGIVKRLEAAGIGCSVVSPVGYQDSDSQLIEQLETAIQKL